MPPTGIQKTAEGFLLATGVMKALATLFVVVIGAIVYVVRTADQLAGAVPERQFLDTTAAIRRDISSIATEAKVASQQSTSIGCYIAKYPAGLCDNVPRASQAGQPRRTP